MNRPSIFYHLKKIGTLNEVITRMGITIENDDVDFLDSFEEQGASEVYQGTYRDTTIQVDAATGFVSQTPQKDVPLKRVMGG